MRILILVGLLFGLIACAPNARPASQAMRAGDPMPSVRLVNLRGEAVNLEAYRNQPVLVNAWGTWCGPCREEMPMLVKLQEQYRKAGLKIIGINFGDSRAKLDAYLKTNPLGFDTWLEGKGTDSTRELLSAWQGSKNGSVGVPFSFAVGRDGRVVGVVFGYDPSGRALEDLVTKAMK
jgi:thiol-disulfide isomerase/thioredoxin